MLCFADMSLLAVVVDVWSCLRCRQYQEYFSISSGFGWLWEAVVCLGAVCWCSQSHFCSSASLVYFSVIFDLSSSLSSVGEGVVIVLVSIAAFGSLLADIVVPVSSKLKIMSYSAAYLVAFFKY